MSQHVVELHVVDLVGSLSLETFVDQRELRLAGLKLEVVEDGAEPSHADEAGSALVFILEERLNQQTAVGNLRAESLHNSVQNLFLFAVKHITGVQNARSSKAGQALRRVLLKVVFGEDLGNVLAEVHVVNERRVSGVFDGVHFLQKFVLFQGKLHLLRVQHRSKFGGRKHSLAQEVVVLEELEKTNAVLLDDLLDLKHEVVKGLAATEVGEPRVVGALGAGVGTVNIKDEHVAVLQEIGVTDLAARGAVAAVNFLHASYLSLAQRKAVGGEHLAEDFGSYLEVAVLVKVLEE